MKNVCILFLISISGLACTHNDVVIDSTDSNIKGFELLNDLKGHWIGTNETAFGFYDWFAFDFRPISASHLHSIYEGATDQNIITSVFIADFKGKQQVMARNGGWLGRQYRTTYFVLDKATDNGNSKYYRLVDAVGKEKRAYMEFRFENDTLYFDAYKDNSGNLDEPVHHMGFKGTNVNPNYTQMAVDLFDFPQKVSEIDLIVQLEDLIDPDSALFLTEEDDPFPKSQHNHLSDLKIVINRENSIAGEELMLYISKKQIVDDTGQVDLDNLNGQLIRTIDIRANESFYTATYLHPDTYFITAFRDKDGNQYPSSGDVSSVSTATDVFPDSNTELEVLINTVIF